MTARKRGAFSKTLQRKSTNSRSCPISRGLKIAYPIRRNLFQEFAVSLPRTLRSICITFEPPAEHLCLRYCPAIWVSRCLRVPYSKLLAFTLYELRGFILVHAEMVDENVCNDRNLCSPCVKCGVRWAAFRPWFEN